MYTTITCIWWNSTINVRRSQSWQKQQVTRISPISITNTSLRTLVFQWISSFLDPIHEGLNDWRDGFDVLLLRKLMIWLWHTMTFIVFSDSKPGYLRHSSLTMSILGQWFWSPFVPCTVAFLHQITLPEIHQWGSVHSRPAPFSLHPVNTTRTTVLWCTSPGHVK